MPAGIPLVDLTRTHVRYRSVHALRGVDLVVHEGERLALLGPSGAGKTTILRVIGAQVLPTEGSAMVLGHDTTSLDGRRSRAIRRRIGTAHQHLALADSLRVLHNVNAGHLGRWSTGRALRSLLLPERDTALAALAEFEVDDLADARTSVLSGGQRQRVALARLIVQDPDVVLADEPAASLDPTLAASAIELLATRVADPGRALIMSVHDPALALQWCNRIVGVRDGMILFDVASDAVNSTLLDQLYRR